MEILVENKKERRAPLNEMALCIVFGDSKYNVISRDPDHTPLHAHVYKRGANKEICAFEVTDEIPTSPEDIVPYKSEDIPEDIRKMIVAQAGRSDPRLPGKKRWEALLFACKLHLQEQFR
jgi:hypothetical protein